MRLNTGVVLRGLYRTSPMQRKSFLLAFTGLGLIGFPSHSSFFFGGHSATLPAGMAALVDRLKSLSDWF